MIYLSIGLVIVLLLVSIRCEQMNKSHKHTLELLDRFVDDMEERNKILQATNENQINWVRFCTNHLKFNATATKYILVCMRSYMIDVQNNALKNENYREAQECKEIIDTLAKLIQYTSNN